MLLNCSSLVALTDPAVVLASWKESDPEAYLMLEKLWKEAESQITDEKKFSDNADKLFKDAFEQVFEGDVSPADTLSMMKLFDDLAVGDYDSAGKSGGEFILSKLSPIMGNYVTLVQGTAKLLDATIKDWVEDLYNTPAYTNLETILEREMYKIGSPYVPSIWINSSVVAELDGLKQEMKAREVAMYSEWNSATEAHETAVDNLVRGPWAARLRQVLNYLPSEQQIFNHFLLHHMSPQRRTVIRRYTEAYLDPLMQKRIRAERKRLRQGMENFLRQLAQEPALEIPEGASYEGGIVDNKPHGEGVIRLKGGAQYSGHFVQGRFDGQGVFVAADKSLYEGTYHRGQMNGKGIITYANRVKYEGDIVAWQPSGQGQMSYPDGRTYSGGFEQGLRSGRGVEVFSPGNSVECDWSKDIIVRSEGVMRTSNGNIYRGIIGVENGKLNLIDGVLSEAPPSTIQYRLYVDQEGNQQKEPVIESFPTIEVEMLAGEGPSKEEVDRVIAFIRFVDGKKDGWIAMKNKIFYEGPDAKRMERLRAKRKAFDDEWKQDKGRLNEGEFAAKWNPRQAEWNSIKNEGSIIAKKLNNQMAALDELHVSYINFRNELLLLIREQKYEEAIFVLEASSIPGEIGFY